VAVLDKGYKVKVTGHKELELEVVMKYVWYLFQLLCC